MTPNPRKGTFKPAFEKRISPDLLAALKRVGGVHELAKACGVNYAMLYDWLSGRNRPRSESFNRVEKYLLDHAGVLLSFELALLDQPEPPTAPIEPIQGSYQIEGDIIRRLDVWLALRRMRERGQGALADVVAKRYLKGMTFVEIGEDQGISFQAVEQRDHRARAVLRKLLYSHKEGRK